MIKTTKNNTIYFTEPEVHLLAKTEWCGDEGVSAFINSYPKELEFNDYLDDLKNIKNSTTFISKFAGQICYLSFGKKRTKNQDTDRYFGHIHDSEHFSVLEHSQFSFLFYGVNRSLTHELVRHRHLNFSQLSQRYCNENALRFVIRPEFDTEESILEFEDYIDKVREDYARSAIKLSALDFIKKIKEKISPTERRKKINQAARYLLPNCVESPIVVSGNVRAWLEFGHKRNSEHAEIEIRILAQKIHNILKDYDSYNPKRDS